MPSMLKCERYNKTALSATVTEPQMDKPNLQSQQEPTSVVSIREERSPVICRVQKMADKDTFHMYDMVNNVTI